MAIQTIEIDVVADDGFVGFMESLASRGLDPTVERWHGPGGGNPLVTITGERSALEEALLSTNYVSDPDELHVYFN